MSDKPVCFLRPRLPKPLCPIFSTFRAPIISHLGQNTHTHGPCQPFPSAPPRPAIRHRPLPTDFTLMSYSRATASGSSSCNFQLIINNALKAYEKRTKKDLLAHPLASQLQACDSPGDILAVLQQQIQGLDQSRSHDERWTKWLDPTVNVLFAFSATLGSGAGLVCPSICAYLMSASSYLSGRYSHRRA